MKCNVPANECAVTLSQKLSQVPAGCHNLIIRSNQLFVVKVFVDVYIVDSSNGQSVIDVT